MGGGLTDGLSKVEAETLVGLKLGLGDSAESHQLDDFVLQQGYHTHNVVVIFFLLLAGREP